jgi:hypothetical protein
MKKVLTSLALLAFATAVRADVVANYTFTGSSLNSSDTDANSSAGVLSNVGFSAATINTSVGNPSPSIQDVGGDITNSANNPPTAATNNATTDYYTFTLTPTGTLFYTSLTLDAATLNANAATSNSFNISLQTGLDGFMSVNNFVVGANTSFTTLGFDLTGLPSSSAPIEFRIAIRDNTTSASNGIAIDNIILNAQTTAAVPEPATWMLMGVGLLLGAQRLRRKA